MVIGRPNSGNGFSESEIRVSVAGLAAADHQHNTVAHPHTAPTMRSLPLLLAALVALAARAAADFAPKGDHSNYDPLGHKKEHTNEHVAAPVKPEDENLAFFKVADVNKDGFLDGYELRTAFTDAEFKEEEQISVNELDEMVEHVLKEDDRNGDGLVSLEEYLASQEYHERAD